MLRVSWLVKLYENLTYVHMRPAAVALKLQRQRYTEQHTPDNILYILKIAIEQTSVGLTHARPKMPFVYK